MVLLFFKAFIMGIVEGVTEFLPISSTGHMIIVADFINFVGKFPTLFEIVIQLGAIFAVIYNYREKILDSLQNLKPHQWGFKLWLKMFVAFIPAAIVGLLMGDFIELHLFSVPTVCVALVIGAILIILTEKYHRTSKSITSIDDVNLKDSLFIGLIQCLSLFPGMSRSASTIIGGLLMGLTASAAAEFSFFLAIPTMFAATGYTLLKHASQITVVELEALIIGFLTSFFVALIVIRKFIKFLTTHKLSIFAYYRLLVGVLLFALLITHVIQ